MGELIQPLIEGELIKPLIEHLEAVKLLLLSMISVSVFGVISWKLLPRELRNIIKLWLKLPYN
ncbi:hypothetical protein [Moraxella lacunata]|uniref:Uncharacterized protein n=1 Tax=Moraxella lacunata TaxID=477 RepID=A0A1V4H4G8_MORLA|nr:hypothetical protein [Moraxella lacunata]OPH39498.1 hypothetical protein B5J94_00150 [Moraxella lacunata]